MRILFLLIIASTLLLQSCSDKTNNPQPTISSGRVKAVIRTDLTTGAFVGGSLDTYDNVGLLIHRQSIDSSGSVDPRGISQDFRYNIDGTLAYSEFRNPNDPSTSIQFSAQYSGGRLVSTNQNSYLSRRITTFSYDALGNIISRVERWISRSSSNPNDSIISPSRHTQYSGYMNGRPSSSIEFNGPGSSVVDTTIRRFFYDANMNCIKEEWNYYGTGWRTYSESSFNAIQVPSTDVFQKVFSTLNGVGLNDYDRNMVVNYFRDFYSIATNYGQSSGQGRRSVTSNITTNSANQVTSYDVQDTYINEPGRPNSSDRYRITLTYY